MKTTPILINPPHHQPLFQIFEYSPPFSFFALFLRLIVSSCNIYCVILLNIFFISISIDLLNLTCLGARNTLLCGFMQQAVTFTECLKQMTWVLLVLQFDIMLMHTCMHTHTTDRWTKRLIQKCIYNIYIYTHIHIYIKTTCYACSKCLHYIE